MAKKIVCVLMMVLMVTGLVFAAVPTAQNATLTLNAGVAPVLQHMFAATGAGTVEEFEGLVGKAVVDNLNLSIYTEQAINSFYNLHTNWSKGVAITATATPFSSDSVGTKVGYVLTVGDETTTVSKDSSVSVNGLFTVSVSDAGSQVYNVEFKTVKMNETDSRLAVAADDYSATITINVTANA